MNYLFAVAIGLLGGLTSGLFGVGGGIIMVPALILFMQQDARAAVATSLAVIVPTTLASTCLNHAAFGRIDWRLVAALAVPAILGGLLSTWFKEQIPSDLLKRLFGGFLLVVGMSLVFSK